MLNKGIIILSGLLIGILLGFLVFTFVKTPVLINIGKLGQKEEKAPAKEVIGFLPYWLLTKAQSDYSKYLTTLTYFSLTIDKDGTIMKFTKPREGEPGWVALNGGRADPFLTQAKEKNLNLSLLVFAANDDLISGIISDPVAHADNLVNDTVPIMKKYGFTDLNLDIENIAEASDSARLNFTGFVREVKNGLANQGINSLTIEVTGNDFVKKKLIDISEVSKLADHVVIMAYDYHNPGSYVTGPVSPLYGGGEISEYDVSTAVRESLKILPPEKVILGMPLYGYEWETLRNVPRSGVIPGTGQTASNIRVEDLLAANSDFSVQKDEIAKESYLIYQDSSGKFFHQIFFPDKTDTLAKINFVRENKLGGIALWALGYEGGNILEPLAEYKQLGTLRARGPLGLEARH